MRRSLRIIAVAAVVAIVLVVGTVAWLTHSDGGRERARRFALGRLANVVHGQVNIGRIEGNVLGDFTLVNVSIADSDGVRLLGVERLSARLDAGRLLSRHVALSGVTLVKPVIHLEQSPGGAWNYERIFPRSEGAVGDSIPGFGDWIALRNVSLRQGILTVRRPWSPDASVSGPTRDSVVRAALAGETRLRVESDGNGFTQRMSFTDINGRLSEAIIADPGASEMRFDVDSLSLVAAPFNPPPLRIRQLSGHIRVGEDSVSIPDLVLVLPASRATGTVAYLVESGDLHAALRIPQLSFADVRTLYVPLPDSGTGSLNLRLAIRDVGASEYTITDANVQVGTARIAGKLGLVVDSILRFRDTDLRAERVSSTLVERVVPGLEVPLRGEVSGHAVLAGPLDALQVMVDASVMAAGHPAFRVVARGGVGVSDAVTVSALSLRADRVPLSLAHAFDVKMPVPGVISLDGVLSGSSAARLRGRFHIVHEERGDRSRAVVEGSVTLGPLERRVDLDARLDRISLGLAQHFVDSLDLQGSVTGTAKVKGTARSLTAALNVTLPGAGRLVGSGSLQRTAGDTLVYGATIRLHDVAPQAMLTSLPIMIVDGEARLRGRGVDPATLTAEVSSRLQLFMIDSAEFRNVTVDARASDGTLFIDTLSATTSFASMSGSGSLGLVPGREGTVRFVARVDDLGGLARWIATGDTGLVAARPAIGERLARLRARADSLRDAARAPAGPAAELAADMRQTGRRPDRRQPMVVAPIARDSIGGSFTVTGEATGNLKGVDVKATARTAGIVWRGSLLGAGTMSAQWRGVGTPNDTLFADGGVDSLRAVGFAFDSTRFRGSYRRGEGNVQLALFPGDTSEYRLDAEYALRSGEGEVRLREIRLRLDSTTWRSTRQSTVSWRGRGITVDSLELRDADGGTGARLFVNGEVPDVDPGRMEFVAERVRLAPWLAILQSDVRADGLISANVLWTGTQRAPRFAGRVAVSGPSYGGTPFPEAETTFEYDQRTMRVDLKVRRVTGEELATVTGTVPIDLSLGDSVATRLLESASLALSIKGDSIPLSPVMEFVDAVTELRGHAFGALTVAGTWQLPQVSGSMGLVVPQMRLVSTGVLMRDGVGQLHMSGDTLVLDSLVARSGGTIRGTGSIVLASRVQPVLQLTFDAKDARVLDDDRGELFADGRIEVRGPIDTMRVTGAAAVTRGVVYIPDPERLDIISTDDPAIFAVVDTATARTLGVAPTSSVLDNLSLDVDVEVRRGTFGRSPEANVEVFGHLDVRLEPGREDFLVTGALYTDQGDYTFLGKRFEVTRGSVRFLVEDELNPLLQIITKYEVQQAGRAPLDIRVVIGGTLNAPKLSLESDAQPTLSQSDLISFLAFGRSSSSLLQFAGTGLEGGGAGGSSLGGNLGALAKRQLASIGLGALVNAARSDLVSATGADVLNITPAQLPADLSLGAFQTLLRGTEIEIGKYVDRQTFLLGRIRPTLAIPGASLERRLSDRLTLQGSLETRFQPRTPSLSSGLEPRTIQLFGALLSWKIAW